MTNWCGGSSSLLTRVVKNALKLTYRSPHIDVTTVTFNIHVSQWVRSRHVQHRNRCLLCARNRSTDQAGQKNAISGVPTAITINESGSPSRQ